MAGIYARYWGYIAVTLSASLFAQISVLTKVAYKLGMTPWQILTLQSLLASLILLIYSLLFRPKVLRISKRQIPKLLAQGLVGSLGTSLFVSFALLYLPASLGIMLLFTYPVLVTFGAFIFFRETIRISHLAALGLAAGGTMLSTQFWQIAAGSLEFKGILLGLASAVTYAFFNLYGEHILNSMEPLTALIYVQLFSSIGLVLYQLPGYMAKNAVLAANWPQFLLGLTMATAASIVPFWLLLEGIKHIGATKASIIGTLELPVTFLMAYVLLDERFTIWQAFSAILIITSIFLVRLQDLSLTSRSKA